MPTEESDEAQGHRKLLQRFFAEVWSDATFDRVDAFVAPESTLHHRGRSVRLTPRELMGTVARWKKAFPDLRFEIQRVVAEGDRAAAHIVHRGTHEGEWRGIPPTGRTVEVEEMMFFRFEDGRIAEIWEVTDEHAERKQLTDSETN